VTEPTQRNLRSVIRATASAGFSGSTVKRAPPLFVAEQGCPVMGSSWREGQVHRLRKPKGTVTIRRFEPRYGFATIVWCAIIFWASLTAELPDERLFDIPQGDKIVHFCGYALLCWLAAMSLRKATRPYRAESLIIVPVVFSIAFGILNEIAQLLVAYRSYEPGDIVADAIGAVSVQAGFIYMQLRKKNET
jgi:VanZ family protein